MSLLTVFHFFNGSAQRRRPLSKLAICCQLSWLAELSELLSEVVESLKVENILGTSTIRLKHLKGVNRLEVYSLF